MEGFVSTQLTQARGMGLPCFGAVHGKDISGTSLSSSALGSRLAQTWSLSSRHPLPKGESHINNYEAHGRLG